MDISVAAVYDQHPQDHHDVADREKHKKTNSRMKGQVRLLLGRINKENKMASLVCQDHICRHKHRDKKAKPLIIHEILVILTDAQRRVHSQ